MMLHSVGAARQTCSLLAVTCGSVPKVKCEEDFAEDKLEYPFPELASSGRLEVRDLSNPSMDEFSRIVESCQPSFVYLQGEHLENDEIGSLVWNGVDLSLEDLCGLFNTTLPTTVYLEVPNGGRMADALYSKGIPYVIYWNNTFSCYAAAHFRNALFSVVQSSSTHTWDAFQLAHAAVRLHCVGSSYALPGNADNIRSDLEPQIIGEPLKIDVEPLEVDAGEGEGEDEDGSLGTLPAISIHDNNVTVRFLICGVPCTPDACLLRSLEDGLNALLNIEIRGSKLQGKFSAPPPPLQAGTFSRGVVTMRCDMVTCSSAHVSILVSGSAHTCFDDQLLEKHIKHEIIENSQLVHAMHECEGNKHHMHEPRKSASVACGATVFEVSMKVPAWASQVLRQLAPDMSYRSLVALGIGGVQGLPVASFEKEDAERLLFFCKSDENDKQLLLSVLPSWFKPPTPSRKRVEPSLGIRSTLSHDNLAYANIPSIRRVGGEEPAPINGFKAPLLPARKRLKVATMRPIPRVHRNKMTPFSGLIEADGNYGGQPKASLPVITPSKHVAVGSTSATQRKSFSSSSQSKQIMSLNPLPLKKHGCGRNPIHDCSEEEFLKDVMEFLLLRGYSRLIPQGGFDEFPDAILNGKRLDLYNLYKEVVTRGGFHVGNGINWKGQIFSKMHNYTMTNRMTGVGNTLKRHYETYLLEYELAHDDVDGECCLLCHSSAAGDWVNCGICGEWAHFGCDRRQGLGAFKDYAKTDGLEYVCPHCSSTTYKKKPHRVANGSPQGTTNPRIP